MSIRKYLTILTVATLLSFNAYAASDIEVDNAWVRTAPPTAKVLAAYMEITNHDNQAQTLIGANSPQFKAVEIHQTQMHEGMMHMKAIDSIIFDSHETVSFEPGGYHFMLIKPKDMVHKGDKIKIELNFKDGSKVVVHASVKDANDDTAHSKSHKHHH